MLVIHKQKTYVMLFIIFASYSSLFMILLDICFFTWNYLRYQSYYSYSYSVLFSDEISFVSSFEFYCVSSLLSKDYYSAATSSFKLSRAGGFYWFSVLSLELKDSTSLGSSAETISFYSFCSWELLSSLLSSFSAPFEEVGLPLFSWVLSTFAF